MIEVLHLIDTYRIGGPGKTIINSARFIDQARFRVHAGAFTSPDAARNEFPAAARAAGVPFLGLEERRRIDPAYLTGIRDYIRRHGIRILHTHGYRSDLLGYVGTRGLDDLVLVTTHHGWIRNSWRQRVMARSAQLLCSRFDGVEVVSARLLEELPRSLRDSGRAEVVHNALVLQDYRGAGRRDETRARVGVGPGDLLLGVVGRLSPEKGCSEMLEAFGRVAGAGPSAHLVFVGEGPLRDELGRRVAELALSDRVHFAGHHREVQPFYEAFDLLVSPSRTEGLSNVILEALAFRLPVVATRVGGNGEILEHDVSGLLVEPQDPPALAAAVLAAARDAGLRHRLGERGRARLEAAFSFEVRMRREEAFYDRVLARRAAGR